MPFRLTVPALAAALAAITLSGCVVAPPLQRVVYAAPPVQQVPTEVIYTEVAPPPPQVEIIGAPRPGYFWISGLWVWQGGSHVWRPGHWEAHRPGYQWTPHQWVPSGHGWQLRGGFWAEHR
nr:YXWGXW repeat-containing protein [uncultured Albidiferax sp.]